MGLYSSCLTVPIDIRKSLSSRFSTAMPCLSLMIIKQNDKAIYRKEKNVANHKGEIYLDLMFPSSKKYTGISSVKR